MPWRRAPFLPFIIIIPIIPFFFSLFDAKKLLNRAGLLFSLDLDFFGLLLLPIDIFFVEVTVGWGLIVGRFVGGRVVGAGARVGRCVKGAPVASNWRTLGANVGSVAGAAGGVKIGVTGDKTGAGTIGMATGADVTGEVTGAEVTGARVGDGVTGTEVEHEAGGESESVQMPERIQASYAATSVYIAGTFGSPHPDPVETIPT